MLTIRMEEAWYCCSTVDCNRSVDIFFVFASVLLVLSVELAALSCFEKATGLLSVDGELEGSSQLKPLECSGASRLPTPHHNATIQAQLMFINDSFLG